MSWSPITSFFKKEDKMTQRDYKGESNSIDDKVKKFSLRGLDNPTMDGAAERNNWFLFSFL